MGDAMRCSQTTPKWQALLQHALTVVIYVSDLVFRELARAFSTLSVLQSCLRRRREPYSSLPSSPNSLILDGFVACAAITFSLVRQIRQGLAARTLVNSLHLPLLQPIWQGFI
jgi:hypothetical protein